MNGVARDSTRQTRPEWVVVLEADVDIDNSSLDRMLHVLKDLRAVALHRSDRFAVQMAIAAGGHTEALFVASARWHLALARVGQPIIEVARAEVISREEFELECRHAYGEAIEPRSERRGCHDLGS